MEQPQAKKEKGLPGGFYPDAPSLIPRVLSRDPRDILQSFEGEVDR